MDTLTILLLSVIGILMVLTLILLGKNFRIRAELRSFREQLNEIRTTDREQPVKVASFSAPSVELAVEINRLVDELKCTANRSAEEEKRLRTIMAGVSHDFRTPLTAVSGYLQLVEEMVGKLLFAAGSECGAEGRDSEEKHNAPGNVGSAEKRIAPGNVGSVEKHSAPGNVGSVEKRSVPGNVGSAEKHSASGIVNSPEVTESLTEIRDYLQIVSERVRYLNALSDEFFEVTYLDAKRDIPLEEVRFDRLLSEVILGQYQWIEDGKIETRFNIPEEQMIISADRHYLERILENLFSNARKYTKSFLEVEVQRLENTEVRSAGKEKAKTGHFQIAMRNDIRENMEVDSAHIFEPFYRAKGRSGQGTGLGLYVCKELAEAMHFTIAGEVKDGVFELKLVV